ncbi:hypothetical protein PBAC_23560 [Pedobacter glucosidilyticus]|nr:hypothetical protein PBAC_23560 [Pedobacter glucosidilyticus]
MMRKRLFVFTLLVASLSSFAQNADAIIGKWLNKDKNAHIQIFKKGNTYLGKIAWLKEPLNEANKPKVDVQNPNENLRERPILNLEILQNFKFNNGIWENGTIYDPRYGKTYSCKISLEGNDKLNVRGFIGVSLIGRTDTWTRIK